MTKVLTALWPNTLAATKAQLPSSIELLECPPSRSESERIAMAAETDLYFGSFSGLTSNLLKAMSGYRLVQLSSAGYDTLDLDTVRKYRIPVATNGGANAAGVAEHTIMLMLACLKHLTRHHALVASGKWTSLHVTEPAELDGRTIGLFGLGFTGRAVAKRLRGWGVNLLYHDLYRQSKEVEQDLGATYVQMDELLAKSDIVSIHSPLNDATRDLFGASALTAMKRGSIIINSSRGGIINETALYDAIVSGHIAGAGLDVLATEPNVSSPLFALEQVVFTPHTAGNAGEVCGKTAANGIANLLRVIGGEAPHYLIPESRQGA